MLARVAERVYWSGRYLERLENAARLINVYSSLLLDLPKNVDLSWYNLVIILGCAEDYDERMDSKSEMDVVQYLLADLENPSSLLTSLNCLRENFRTTRDVIPADTWELVNELHLLVQAQVSQQVPRSLRHEFLNQVVLACQQINGLLMGEMPRDSAWNFIRMGRNLERADMTTRFLDAGAAAVLYRSFQSQNHNNAPNFEQIVWCNVLVSASAMQAYLRHSGGDVDGPEVAEYLLFNENFPRSFAYCMKALKESVSDQPLHFSLMADIEHLEGRLEKRDHCKLLDEAFRDYLNDLQLDIGRLHHRISNHWFAAHS